MNNPHPLAKLFAPVVFSSLALLAVGMSFGPAQADQPPPETEAPRVQPLVDVPALPASR